MNLKVEPINEDWTVYGRFRNNLNEINNVSCCREREKFILTHQILMYIYQCSFLFLYWFCASAVRFVIFVKLYGWKDFISSCTFRSTQKHGKKWKVKQTFAHEDVRRTEFMTYFGLYYILLKHTFCCWRHNQLWLFQWKKVETLRSVTD